MEQRITLITLGVRDHKKSRDFYLNVFGWTPMEASNDNITFFQLNDIKLALFSEDALAEDAAIKHDGSGFRRFSLAYNVESEKKVDEVYAELVHKGATPLKKPEKVFWGGYSSYVADRMEFSGRSPTIPSCKELLNNLTFNGISTRHTGWPSSGSDPQAFRRLTSLAIDQP